MQAIVVGVLVGLLALTGVAASATVDRVEGPLTVEASLSKRTYVPGEPVEVTLVARNTGSAPLGIVFTSGQRYDLIVRRPRGDEVWRWSHDQAFVQVVQTALLRPQEAMAFRGAWDQQDLQGRRVDPGSYELVAVFMGRTEAGRPPITLPPLSFNITR